MITWQRVAGTLARNSLDQVVLLPPIAERPIAVSLTGAVLWDALATPATEESLIAGLTDLFGLAGGSAAERVHEALEVLEAEGAVAHRDD